MDHAQLERFLRQAQTHVALGRDNIQRLWEAILDVEASGKDAITARRQLQTAVALQEMRLGVVDRLSKQLAENGK